MTTEQMEISVNLKNEKVQFAATSKRGQLITVDHRPPVGDGDGYQPLELLLMSLASCSASTIVTQLRKMNKDVDSFEVKAQGIKNGLRAAAFDRIFLHFNLRSRNVQDKDMLDVIRLSEESYCPVWAMLKNNVDVVPEYHISPVFND
ncbi:MAG TPA: OsmC family protein [Bacteroidota bacterium]|nr:OsmC family protein [Bacteroidota bacterium]